jgi:hypothetical protein
MERRDDYISREHQYSIGIDSQNDQHYVSIPVSAQFFGYEEFYKVTNEQYDNFLVYRQAALAFVEECRRQGHDDLLTERPGPNRGTAI